MPEGDDEPVEHQPVRGGAVPESEAERAPRVATGGEHPQEKDRRREGDETENGEVERGIARGEQHRAQRDEKSRPPAAHNCTSRPSSADRLNSSHSQISYAVFCLKKKKK